MKLDAPPRGHTPGVGRSVAVGGRQVEAKRAAADALKLTARDLFALRIIDDIITEPLGAAHRDPRQMGNLLKAYLLRHLRDLKQIALPELLEQRYQKFRKMGVFDEGVAEAAAAGNQ